MQQRRTERGQHVETRHSRQTTALLIGLVLVGAPAPAAEAPARPGGAQDLTGPLMAIEELPKSRAPPCGR
jgi:hypothetical protein